MIPAVNYNVDDLLAHQRAQIAWMLVLAALILLLVALVG
jgi:hypothetical protein